MVFGLLNVNKPSGPTSHDIVQAARRGTRERRIGHAGTLDPLAQGVLVLALGKATRLTEYMMSSTKSYVAEARLGVETDSYDTEGEVVAQRPVPPSLIEAKIESVLAGFRGEIEQVPPVYSAIKVKGKSAHERVRAGEQVKLETRPVEIHHLQLLAYEPPLLRVSVRCSAGTYIRSLVHDIGQVLGCGMTLTALTRTASGDFRLEDSADWRTLIAAFDDGSWREYLLPADRALKGTPQMQLDSDSFEQVAHGGFIGAGQPVEGLARAYAPDGRFVAVLQGDPSTEMWRPKKVFV